MIRLPPRSTRTDTHFPSTTLFPSLVLPQSTLVIVDTHVNENPTAAQLAEITIRAAEEMKYLGVEPKAALLSHSNFGTSQSPSAVKMRETLALVREQAQIGRAHV